MDALGRIKKAVKAQNDNLFVEGFVKVSLIICVGINISFGKKFKVGNLLPALIVPMIYDVLCSFK